ncbi:F-box only protein 42 [Balamuthia mandrillaris]
MSQENAPCSADSEQQGLATSAGNSPSLRPWSAKGNSVGRSQRNNDQNNSKTGTKGKKKKTKRSAKASPDPKTTMDKATGSYSTEDSASEVDYPAEAELSTAQIGCVLWIQPGTRGTAPLPRWGHTSCAYGNSVVVFGGMGNRVRGDYFIFDLEKNWWQEVTTSTGQAPSPRFGHSCCLLPSSVSLPLRNKLLLFGGRTDGNKQLNDLFVLDLEKHFWKRFSPDSTFPEGRAGHTATVISNKLVLFGGQTSRQKYLNSVYTLCFDTMKWTKHKALGKGPTPRGGHDAVAYKGELLVFGGFDGKKYYNDLHVLNLTSMTWRDVKMNGVVPSERSGHTITLLDDKLLLFGGCSANSCFLNDIHVLLLDSLTWIHPPSQGQSLAPRFRHTATLVGNSQIYVYGGSGSGIIFNDIAVLEVSELQQRGSPEGIAGDEASFLRSSKDGSTSAGMGDGSSEVSHFNLSFAMLLGSERKRREEAEAMVTRLENALNAEVQLRGALTERQAVIMGSLVCEQEKLRAEQDAKKQAAKEKTKLQKMIKKEQERRRKEEEQKKRLEDNLNRLEEQLSKLEEDKKHAEERGSTEKRQRKRVERALALLEKKVHMQELELERLQSLSTEVERLRSENASLLLLLHSPISSTSPTAPSTTCTTTDLKPSAAHLTSSLLSTLPQSYSFCFSSLAFQVDEIQRLPLNEIEEKEQMQRKLLREILKLKAQKQETEAYADKKHRPETSHTKQADNCHDSEVELLREEVSEQKRIIQRLSQVNEELKQQKESTGAPPNLDSVLSFPSEEKLQELSIEQLNELEEVCHKALKNVGFAKQSVLQKQLETVQREKEQLEGLNRCVVCTDREIKIVLLPCGHRCLCQPCGELLARCPICRQTVQSKITVF